MKDIVYIKYYQAPCGSLILGSFNEKLCLCDWEAGKNRIRTERKIKEVLHADFRMEATLLLEKATSQLNEYFSRVRKEFELPLLLIGTDFQKRVWNALMDIPYGTTISYAELARRIGDAKAVRAVAAANGANPISIFAPCHRVIGSNQKLIGYGGGLEVKKRLLELER